MLTLSSDFGSPYPAAMKGVVLQHTDARLVDVTHDFPRQDVRSAAFWLREILPYFPPAVHLVVVDPTVGTDRRAVAVRVGEHALVGPDNGVLRPVARRLADRHDASIETFAIEGDDPSSSTFHGRDVFAPAAGIVHEIGVATFEQADRFHPIEDPVELTFPEPVVREDGADGEVLAVDDFGNVITNIPGDVLDLKTAGTVTVNDRAIEIANTYATVSVGDPLVTVGSHGNVELAVREGRGDAAFDLGVGDHVALRQ